MSWSVTFRGTSSEIEAAFDLAAERSRDCCIGELEDMHQARVLTLSTASLHDCQLSGTAHGYWIGVDFHAFSLSVQRYVPPADVQLQLPTEPDHTTPFAHI